MDITLVAAAFQSQLGLCFVTHTQVGPGPLLFSHLPVVFEVFLMGIDCFYWLKTVI